MNYKQLQTLLQLQGIQNVTGSRETLTKHFWYSTPGKSCNIVSTCCKNLL